VGHIPTNAQGQLRAKGVGQHSPRGWVNIAPIEQESRETSHR
jgi:hypothetical protein